MYFKIRLTFVEHLINDGEDRNRIVVVGKTLADCYQKVLESTSVPLVAGPEHLWGKPMLTVRYEVSRHTGSAEQAGLDLADEAERAGVDLRPAVFGGTYGEQDVVQQGNVRIDNTWYCKCCRMPVEGPDAVCIPCFGGHGRGQ